VFLCVVLVCVCVCVGVNTKLTPMMGFITVYLFLWFAVSGLTAST